MKKLIALAAILGLAVPAVGAAAPDEPQVRALSAHAPAAEHPALVPTPGANDAVAEAQAGYYLGTFLIGRYALFAEYGGVVQAFTQGFGAGVGGFIGGYIGAHFGGFVGGLAGAGFGAGIGGV